MKTAGTMSFVDRGSSDEAIIVVRYDEGVIGLAISLKTDGDVEVFMGKDEARSLIETLKTAVG